MTLDIHAGGREYLPAGLREVSGQHGAKHHLRG